MVSNEVLSTLFGSSLWVKVRGKSLFFIEQALSFCPLSKIFSVFLNKEGLEKQSNSIYIEGKVLILR